MRQKSDGKVARVDTDDSTDSILISLNEYLVSLRLPWGAHAIVLYVCVSSVLSHSSLFANPFLSKNLSQCASMLHDKYYIKLKLLNRLKNS